MDRDSPVFPTVGPTTPTPHPQHVSFACQQVERNGRGPHRGPFIWSCRNCKASPSWRNRLSRSFCLSRLSFPSVIARWLLRDNTKEKRGSGPDSPKSLLRLHLVLSIMVVIILKQATLKTSKTHLFWNGSRLIEKSS